MWGADGSAGGKVDLGETLGTEKQQTLGPGMRPCLDGPSDALAPEFQKHTCGAGDPLLPCAVCIPGYRVDSQHTFVG